MNTAKLIRSRAVITEHEKGLTVKAIAKKYGISDATVRGYIKEAREKKADALAAEQKEAERAKKKKERNNERRNTIEVRMALKDERKERVKADIQAGMSMHEAAEKEGLSYGTVGSYVRGEKIPEFGVYKDLMRTAVSKYEIRKWAKDQLMSQLKTPKGKMTVCEVYPHILRLVDHTGTVSTYTAGELYYINTKK